MPRQRSPDSIKAEDMYLDTKGQIQLKDIAEEIGVAPGTVRSWKNRYRWDEMLKDAANATLQKSKNSNECNVANKSKGEKTKLVKIAKEANLEDAELTEKQRLFCLYYVKTFNATMAAMKAGYSKDTAHVIGCENLKKPKIAKEVKRLKGTMTQDIFIDALDVLNKYVKIAFADITDYVTFGRREVPVMTMFGPAKDGDGNIVTKKINYVDFNESKMIDGTIIKEVKQGKEGVAIKFVDKIKALEKLEKYFDLIPDKWKRKIEEEKIALAKLKAGEDAGEGQADDGFIEALQGKVKEVWADEE